MKPLAAAAVGSALVTAVAAWALRATDPSLAVAAVAAVVVLVAWLVSFHTDGDTDPTEPDGGRSGLALAGPAQLVPLALVGRHPVATALPVVAAQVVGAVAAGALVRLADLEGGTLLWDEPSLLAAGVLGALVGVVVAWATLATDGAGPAWTAAGPVASGALLGVGLAAAAQPAALLGVAVAGLVSWPVALVAAGAVLVGATVGTFVVSWVSPHDA